MARVYYDGDADISLLKGKTIAIIGYGSQGHAQAQNLRDSGLKVIVGELIGSAPARTAKADGFEVMVASEAVKMGDIVQVLVPDDVQSRLYKAEIGPNMKEGSALGFAHGFNIHYGQIVPPPSADVFMVAPKSPGHLVRRMYKDGKGVPSLLAIYQDASGKARQIALAYAKGLGSTKAGVIETTFKEETETDLFGEQAVLCGGVTELIRAGFDTLVEAGYQPEVAYFECLNELKLIVDLIFEGGIGYMRRSVSDTAKYGDVTRGKRIITEQTRQEMRRMLAEVQSGEFAREWILENQANRPVFNARMRQDAEHVIEKVGAELRKMMSWIGEPKK